MIFLPILLHWLGVSTKYVAIIAVGGIVVMKKLKAAKKGRGNGAGRPDQAGVDRRATKSRW